MDGDTYDGHDLFPTFLCLEVSLPCALCPDLDRTNSVPDFESQAGKPTVWVVLSRNHWNSSVWHRMPWWRPSFVVVAEALVPCIFYFNLTISTILDDLVLQGHTGKKSRKSGIGPSWPDYPAGRPATSATSATSIVREARNTTSTHPSQEVVVGSSDGHQTDHAQIRRPACQSKPPQSMQPPLKSAPGRGPRHPEERQRDQVARAVQPAIGLAG